MTLASDVITTAQALLNDPSGSKYTSTKLLPFVIKVSEDLQLLLALHEANVQYGVFTLSSFPAATPSSIPAGGGANQYPLDLVSPLYMEEKDVGAGNDQYVPMERRDWEDSILPTTSLRYWTWRDLIIKFVGSTAARDLKVRYLQRLITVSAAGSTIEVIDSKPYMQSRVAALAAAAIGENIERAKLLNDDAEEQKNNLVALITKDKQAIPSRRLPYRGRIRTWR